MEMQTNKDWGPPDDFLLLDGIGNPCKISYLVKIKPYFSPLKW